MANICDTKLAVNSTKETTATAKEMIAWLDENYVYDGSGGFEDTGEIFGEPIGDDEVRIIEGYAGTRWNVNDEILQEFCKLFKVSARAIGIEEGVGFVQVVQVNAEGEVFQNDEIGF